VYIGLLRLRHSQLVEAALSAGSGGPGAPSLGTPDERPPRYDKASGAHPPFPASVETPAAQAALAAGSPLRRVWFASSFFWPKLTEDRREGGRVVEAGYCFANVARWTKRDKVDIFACRLVLVPLNYSNTHWALGAVYPRLRRIEVYDSLGGGARNDRVAEVLARWVADEWADKKAKEHVSKGAGRRARGGSVWELPHPEQGAPTTPCFCASPSPPSRRAPSPAAGSPARRRRPHPRHGRPTAGTAARSCWRAWVRSDRSAGSEQTTAAAFTGLLFFAYLNPPSSNHQPHSPPPFFRAPRVQTTCRWASSPTSARRTLTASGCAWAQLSWRPACRCRCPLSVAAAVVSAARARLRAAGEPHGGAVRTWRPDSCERRSHLPLFEYMQAVACLCAALANISWSQANTRKQCTRRARHTGLGAAAAAVARSAGATTTGAADASGSASPDARPALAGGSSPAAGTPPTSCAHRPAVTSVHSAAMGVVKKPRMPPYAARMAGACGHS
jgi:hypothetical protein